MRKQYLLAAACTLVLSLAGAVQAKPNFSGDWKLNSGKSDFGPMPGPEKMDRKITHEDPSFKFSTTQTSPQGETTTDMAYTTDGKPATNKTARGEVTGTAKWDGDVLTIGSKREFQGMEITQNERWTLGEDGKTLTITNKINTPQGDFEIKIVMDKQ
jgi:hypothetical protein